MASPIQQLRAVQRRELRLFLFHAAGGSHLMFRGWEEEFPSDWELCTVEAPGRGRLASLPLQREAGGIASFVMPALVPLLDGPFAFFGHSMGAVVAYDLARRLCACGLPEPVWLGISARRPPGETPTGVHRLNWDLPQAELKHAVALMGGTSATVLENARLWAILEPILRADLHVADSWRSADTADFVAPPISVFTGANDPFVSSTNLASWSQATVRFMGMHTYPGGHFYLQRSVSEIARDIGADITSAYAQVRAA